MKSFKNLSILYKIITISIIFTIIMMGLLISFNISFHSDLEVSDMISDTIFRFLGGFIFVLLIYILGHKVLHPFKKPFFKSLLISMPALLVVINNFPFIDHLAGNTELLKPTSTVLIFLISCISVGFFEEVVFRGVILILFLQNSPKTKQGILFSIIASSAIFALMHLFNLFSGAGFGQTVLQIGYSFLMGLMFSVLLIKTKNIWLPVILHSLYNFGGLLFPTLGRVTSANEGLTMIVTGGIAFLVAIYTIHLFQHIEPKDINSLYINDTGK